MQCTRIHAYVLWSYACKNQPCEYKWHLSYVLTVFNVMSYFCKLQENICVGGKLFVGLVYINALVNNDRAKLKKIGGFFVLT